MIGDLGLRIADSAGALQSALHNSQSAITWNLLLEPEGRSGQENMAFDEALLADAARTGAAWLRLYRWEPPCLSFGRNEPARTRYNRAAIERLGLDVVRRPTGGRAVWHEHEVTYAVAAPVAAFGSLRAAYHAIHERLAAALRSLGAAIEIAPDRPPAHPHARLTACFSSAVGGELLAGGKKVAGSAQVRLGDALLQHGSILLGGSQDVVRAVSGQPSAASGETTLAAALGRAVTFQEVVDAITRTWCAPEERIAAGDPPAHPPTRPPAYSETWRR